MMEAGSIIFAGADVLLVLNWKWRGEMIYCVRSMGTEQEPVYYGNEKSVRDWVKTFGNYRIIPASEWTRKLRSPLDIV